MWNSSNFDSDDACQLLIQLIDTATALKIVYIVDQRGKRKIDVKITYAVHADPSDEKVVLKQGSIKVIEKYGDSQREYDSYGEEKVKLICEI